ncbi:PTS transporter subunit EIIC [Streptomyces luteireticuli]|uniref:PTS transporter subunit EIIC n=1 Tax=Streptomyces luteireticuli TaxID=173858 RepID=UPI0035586636
MKALKLQRRPGNQDQAAEEAVAGAEEAIPDSRLRRMGKGLALPIAAMPAAGLLLRLGQPDLIGRYAPLHDVAGVLSSAGGAVLDYLPLLFAVGIGLGLCRSKDTAGPVLACAVTYLMLSRTISVLNPHASHADTPLARQPYGALSGIVAGLLAMAVWKVVERRRIPGFAAYAIVALAAIAAGCLMGLAYPLVDKVLSAFAGAIADHAVIGGGLFGVVNRLLLPLGLHHVPSTLVWYVTGDCGNNIKGDIPCFFQARDKSAGIFMGGFFPVSIFGLPAAAIAMWHSAGPSPQMRRRAAQLLLPAAGMSAAFGITEPIELAFAFTATPLYVVHALLTGLSMAIVNALGIHSGFLFSAGTLDLVFNAPISTRPLWLLPIGVVYGALYYVIFRFAITRFDLRTPGRTPAGETEADTLPNRQEGTTA